MQDVEQGEPQSQVLFRVTFLQCITLARQTLHHKSATYQQRHHEAARLPDPPARGPAPGSALSPPGSLRRIRTGEPAATGAGRRGRDRPGGDERHAGRRRSGERNHPRRAPPEPPPGRRRGEWDHVGSVAAAGAVPAGRPGAAVEAVAHCVLRTGSGRTTGGGRVRIHWSGMGRLCDVADEDAGGRHEPGPVGGCSGSDGVRVDADPHAGGLHEDAPGRTGSAGDRRVVCGTPSRLLRLFPSAALLHPLLRLFFSYSGRSRGVAEGKGRSRCGRGRARGYRRAWSRRPTRPFRPIGSARLTAGAGGPVGGVVRRLGKAADAHLPASAPRPSSSHSSTNPGEKGSTNGIHVRESRS